MQTTTATTPEVKEGTTPSVSHEKTGHANQKKIQSNNQEKSFIRTFYRRSEWSDTLELLGWIFLTIIIYIVSFELARFCVQHLWNTPSEAFLYQYQCVLCVMVLIISIAFVFLAVHVIICVLSIATEFIFLTMVKYYYIEGRNSYKWWQKKTGIKCIIVSIMFLIWFVIIVELGYSIFGNTDVKTLIKDRWFLHRWFGLVTIVCSSVIIAIAFGANISVRALIATMKLE